MKKIITSFLLLVSAAYCSANTSIKETPFTNPVWAFDAPDPTWWEADGNYYLASTRGSILKSTDFINWKLEKKDSLSTLNEMIRITKATDGKAVFLYYSLTERSAISGTVIANHGYTILFPITTASAHATRPGRK
jgi:hypothetical protein